MTTLLVISGVYLALRYGLAPFLVRWAFRAPRLTAQSTPSRFRLPHRQVSIATEHGKRLRAWYIPPTQSAPAPAVAILHGWGGSADSMLSFGPSLHDAGFALLFLDARNHGRSDQDDFSSLVKFAEDLEHGLDWLEQQPDVQNGRLSAVGHSVGAAAALLVASRRHTLNAVVGLATFAHPACLMQRLMRRHHIPYFPVGWWVLRYIEQQIGAKFDDIAPANTIRKVTCPVLLLHGARDESVPLDDAEAIYRNRTTENVELRVFADATHDETGQFDQCASEIARFLIRHNSGSSG